MKIVLFLLSFIMIVLFSCKQSKNDGFVINGKIEKLEAPYIYLSWRVGDSTHTDSAAVKEGKFVFKGQVPNPVLSRIYGKGLGGYIWFYLENSSIHITGKSDSIFKTKKIAGSKSEGENEEFKALTTSIDQQYHTLSKEYSKAKKASDSSKMEVILKKENDLDLKKAEKAKEFIRANPQSFISLYHLQNLTYSSTYEELNKMFTGLDKTVENSLPGKKFADHLAIMEKTSIGKTALPFTQNNVNGKPVSLSDFKGKYVLIDFWASWCGPCRAENPNVVKAFNKYKHRNFTVLGISLDTKKDHWKEAIKHDGLQWMQVSDLKGWDNKVAQEYGVHAIPANWLINPNGKIIGHNLRGKILEKKLSEIIE